MDKKLLILNLTMLYKNKFYLKMIINMLNFKKNTEKYLLLH